MTYLISKKLTVLSLILALGFSPVLSYAKDNSNEKNHEDRESFIWDCFLPFGIHKKFRGTASSTTDTIAPIITRLSIRPNTQRAVVTWRTDEQSDSTIFWSTSANVDVNSSSTASIKKDGRVKAHRILIENLTASTTYYLIVRSKDTSGNINSSSETSFVTKALIPDHTPPVISAVATLVSTSTIHVSWRTNENASSRVYYGTSAGLDVNASTTSFVETSTLSKEHTLSVNNLASSTTYYLSAESKDSSNNRSVTPVFSAITLGLF
jgi:Purple acid Phosphatase, N-terminal domain